MTSDKLFSDAAERNREPILRVLQHALSEQGLVLEIASGTGQHAVFFARGLPNHVWQPSDIDPAARDSIAARVEEAGLANLRPPVALDVRAATWPVSRAAAIVCINMIHISEWACCEALFRGAARAVQPGGVAFLYGPFRIEGRPTAPSNERFDESLRARDPAWGLRWLHDVEAVAKSSGFSLDKVVDMPANNISAVFVAGARS